MCLGPVVPVIPEGVQIPDEYRPLADKLMQSAETKLKAADKLAERGIKDAADIRETHYEYATKAAQVIRYRQMLIDAGIANSGTIQVENNELAHKVSALAAMGNEQLNELEHVTDRVERTGKVIDTAQETLALAKANEPSAIPPFKISSLNVQREKASGHRGGGMTDGVAHQVLYTQLGKDLNLPHPLKGGRYATIDQNNPLKGSRPGEPPLSCSPTAFANILQCQIGPEVGDLSDRMNPYRQAIVEAKIGEGRQYQPSTKPVEKFQSGTFTHMIVPELQRSLAKRGVQMEAKTLKTPIADVSAPGYYTWTTPGHISAAQISPENPQELRIIDQGGLAAGSPLKGMGFPNRTIINTGDIADPTSIRRHLQQIPSGKGQAPYRVVMVAANIPELPSDTVAVDTMPTAAAVRAAGAVKGRKAKKLTPRTRKAWGGAPVKR